jgi:hypothetical protein
VADYPHFRTKPAVPNTTQFATFKEISLPPESAQSIDLATNRRYDGMVFLIFANRPNCAQAPYCRLVARFR